jgi:hypothetical protein
MIMYTFEVIDKDRVDLEEFNHFKDKLINLNCNSKLN